nr:CoA pyrophosphatase [uncultured Sphingomonas sp.]
MTLIQRLEERLASPAPAGILPGDLLERDHDDARDAAVLVAITEQDHPGLILTVRRENMRTHAGQVAFPGGRIDEGEDAITAALREAWEELALPVDRARVIGLADPYRTVTDYVVTPVVACVAPPLSLLPNPDEVADWFEVPLDFVLDPANQRQMTAEYQGRTRHYYQIDWEGHKIWGATAAMLVNLTRRLA